MSGSAFSMATIFALSIQPYINSSIIIQLLTVAIPALERLAKEGGEEGRKKIASITRYATVAIALLQGFGYYSLIKSYGLIESSALSGVWVALVIVLSFTAGSAFLMWLGEQITEFGVGNGISIILFAGIVSRFPRMISDCVSGVTIWSAVKNGTMTEETLTAAGYSATQAKAQLSMALAPWMIPVIVIGMLALVVFIVFISNAERRLPVQYAKRVVGRKMYGGQSTHIPMKVNMSGVMPIIFAQSIAALPATIGAFAGWTTQNSLLMRLFDTSKPFYSILYFLLIVGFSYFYATMQFNPVEVSNNLKKNGLHPRLPSRQAHRRFYHQGSEQDHHVWRAVSVCCGHRAHHHGQYLRLPLPGHRRYLRHHRGGRGPGDREADGGSDAHAAL